MKLSPLIVIVSTFYIGWRGGGRVVRPLSFEDFLPYFFFRMASLIVPDYIFINLAHIHSSDEGVIKNKIVSNHFSAYYDCSLIKR